MNSENSIGKSSNVRMKYFVWYEYDIMHVEGIGNYLRPKSLLTVIKALSEYRYCGYVIDIVGMLSYL